ncbi:MAG: glycosyltransferase family 2 protein [Pseudomonadota bacterium]|nr:glycosyltransferase family 2 protein [Pseudomonadota bacterium]
MPLVSIVFPVRAIEGAALRAVASLRNQTHENWELLIVSDDDRSCRRELARRGCDDGRIRFIASPFPDAGPNVARNTGLHQARGEFVALMDANDRYHPERLASLVPLASDHGMAADNVNIVEIDSGRCLRTVLPLEPTIVVLDLERFLCIDDPLSFVFHHSVLRHQWDEDVVLQDDSLFMLRALERAGEAVVLTEPLHDHFIAREGISARLTRQRRAEIAYTYCLHKLEINGLGFWTESFRQAAGNMLFHKRALSRAYTEAISGRPAGYLSWRDEGD